MLFYCFTFLFHLVLLLFFIFIFNNNLFFLCLSSFCLE